MRKEYIPAIVWYVISAILYAAAVILLLWQSHHWATLLILGVAAMLYASSKLVNIGKKLREEEDWSEKQDE